MLCRLLVGWRVRRPEECVAGRGGGVECGEKRQVWRGQFLAEFLVGLLNIEAGAKACSV